MSAVTRIQTSASRLRMTDTRTLYLGSLGRPGRRAVGAHVIYASFEHPFELQFSNDTRQSAQAQQSRLAVVPAHCFHTLTVNNPNAWGFAYLIETESLFTESLHRLLALNNNEPAAERLLSKLQQYCEDLPRIPATGQQQDSELLGFCLQPRRLDRRIEHIAERVAEDPSAGWSAGECAGKIHLSRSRFLHLFKDTVGIGFRQWRAWRRARATLGIIDASERLTDVALSLGYPDAAHFCHSIKHAFGMSPTALRNAVADGIPGPPASATQLENSPRSQPVNTSRDAARALASM